jgi:hypothetical protein
MKLYVNESANGGELPPIQKLMSPCRREKLKVCYLRYENGRITLLRVRAYHTSEFSKLTRTNLVYCLSKTS